MTLLEQIEEWQNTANEAKRAAAKEKKQRNALLRLMFPGLTSKEGTYSVVEGEIVVKASHGFNRKLDDEGNGDTDDNIGDIRSMLLQHNIPANIIVDKPALDKKVYNTLDKEQRDWFDDVALIIKPSQATLKVEPAPLKMSDVKHA